MALDLVRVAEQMPSLLQRVADTRGQARARRERAQLELGRWAARPDEWRARLEAGRSRWPLALPELERVDTGYTAPAAPVHYTALAVDGSHIDVDRNAAAPCYVLNFGWAAIRYGDPISAWLESAAELQPSSEGLVERDQTDASREHQMRGELLAMLRSVRELDRLSVLAAELCSDDAQHAVVALLDGNLGLWNVSQAAIPKRLRERFIHDEGGLLPSLERLRALAAAHRLAFGAYTSAPGTSEVVHALRLAVCPLEQVECTRCPGLMHAERPCDSVAVSGDAELFWHVLRPGERSAVFRAFSRPFLRADAADEPLWYEQHGHTVGFFYLRLEDEVARVELPLWAAEDQERVGLLHAALLDQCAKGPGYPVALQEAHEQAVITTVDRRSFAALLERELELAGETLGGSAKARSKRMRTI